MRIGYVGIQESWCSGGLGVAGRLCLSDIVAVVDDVEGMGGVIDELLCSWMDLSSGGSARV